MKLQDILTEILSRVDEIKIDPSDVHFNVGKIVEYNFSVGGLNYRCVFRPSTVREFSSVGVKFLLLNNPKAPSRDDFESEMTYQDAIRKSMLGTTGTGNVFHIFGRVLSALKKYTDEYSPDYITFDGDEARAKLYKSFDKYVGKNFPEYKMININPNTGTEPEIGEFWLKKI